jgi:hypothetical protein
MPSRLLRLEQHLLAIASADVSLVSEPPACEFVSAQAGRMHSPSISGGELANKVREYDSHIQGRHRGDLTAAQREELDAGENQIVSLTRWLVLVYPGPPETTNCADEKFHDWRLEIFEKPSDHAPQVGDPTPIICEITPRTERLIYREGVRIQSLAGFFAYRTRATGQPDTNRRRFG